MDGGGTDRRGMYRPNGHVASNPLLCGFQGTLNGKYLRHTLRSLDKWNPSTKRILEDTHINEDFLYKEIPCSSRLG